MDRKKLLIVGIGVLVVVVVLVLFFMKVLGDRVPAERATLEFWGTFDEPKLYRKIIDDYEAEHPLIDVVYKQYTFEDYEKALLSGFAAGTGPDIWLMHNTWLPKHADKISPLPEVIAGSDDPLFTFKQFKDQFVDVAVADLTRDEKTIYAIPTYVDSLALYYNKDILNSAGISVPPRTWEDFVRAVDILTTQDDRNNITKSAAAIGTSRNINRSTDLLMLLMLQSGVRMTNADNTGASFSRPVDGINVGELSLQFYTDFANQAKPDRYTWNDQQQYSIDAFAEGNTAMMLNYSHHITTIRARSPRLNFHVAPAPQPERAAFAVNFGNYWAPTVARESEHPEEAWKFLVHLATSQATLDYLSASDRPAARRDLIEAQRNDPDLGTYAVQALSARSWYQADNTAIESIFAKMIDAVNFNRSSVKDALQEAENQVSVIMERKNQ